MGLNFRGGKKANFSTKNQHGFQEKSAPGPRRGVGGDQSYNTGAAEKRFSKPLSIKVSTNPITQRAKPSPLKINNALVQGAALTGEKFNDVSAAVGEAFKPYEEPKTVDLKVTKEKEPVKESEFKVLGNDAAKTITPDLTEKANKLKKEVTTQAGNMFGGSFGNGKKATDTSKLLKNYKF